LLIKCDAKDDDKVGEEQEKGGHKEWHRICDSCAWYGNENKY